jgi:hypothetical protein
MYKSFLIACFSNRELVTRIQMAIQFRHICFLTFEIHARGDDAILLRHSRTSFRSTLAASRNKPQLLVREHGQVKHQSGHLRNLSDPFASGLLGLRCSCWRAWQRDVFPSPPSRVCLVLARLFSSFLRNGRVPLRASSATSHATPSTTAPCANCTPCAPQPIR